MCLSNTKLTYKKGRIIKSNNEIAQDLDILTTAHAILREAHKMVATAHEMVSANYTINTKSIHEASQNIVNKVNKLIEGL